MSQTSAPTTPLTTEAGSPWAARRRQTMAVMLQEAGRILGSRRGLGLYFLTLLPVGLSGLRAVVLHFLDQAPTVGSTTEEFAALFRHLILTITVFFACAAVFSNSIRRQVLERTLHLSFLLPLRREVLLVGRVLGGTLAVGTVVGLSTLATFLLAYQPAGVGNLARFLFRGPGLGHLVAYVAIALLAVAAYGAFFFFLGLVFRRPAIPVILFFGWELLIPLLPPLLKHLSIAYYVRSLSPVPVAEGPFAILAANPEPWVAIPGLLVVLAVLLWAGAWRLRGMEVLYGED